MAMSSSVLAAELESLTPVETEAAAIVTLTDAYGVFAADAVADAVALNSAGVDLGKVAMAAALVGMNAPNAGALKITQGVIAFWTAVAGGLATSFTGATAITPPPHAGLEAALNVTFAANLAASASLPDAAAAVAAVMYAQAIVGGSATFPGPVVSAIT